jgi:LysM repeat protein
VSLSAIEQANPQLSDPNLIIPGEQISLVPGLIPVTGGIGSTVQPIPGSILPGAFFTHLGDTLDSMAQNFGVTRQELINANPQITDWKKLPAGVLVNLPPTAGQNLSPYQVQSGDTLESIAQSYNIPKVELEEVNPQITDWGQIFAGEIIYLPAYLNTSLSTYTLSTYTVQSGDSLNSIANSFGVSRVALRQANPQITNWRQIYTGELIYLPADFNPSLNAYTVQSGDTWTSIADSFGLSLGALEGANPQITDWGRIYTGEVIYIG